jgi:hypothetical protein
MKIYIAGPYSADTAAQRQANTTAAIDAGLAMLELGHYPFIPHLTHYVDKRAEELDIEMEWEDYIEWDSQFLQDCDAFLYLGSSTGADLERERAEELGLNIYTDIESVPESNT